MAGGQEDYPQLPTLQTDQDLSIKVDGDLPTQKDQKHAAPSSSEGKAKTNERFASLRQAYESAPEGGDEKAAALKRWQAESTRFRDSMEQHFEKSGIFLAPPEPAETGPSQEQMEREKHVEFIIRLLIEGYIGRCSNDANVRDSASVFLFAAGFGVENVFGMDRAQAMYKGGILGSETWDQWMNDRWAEASAKCAELREARQTTQQQQSAPSRPDPSYQEQLLQQHQRNMSLEQMLDQSQMGYPQLPHQQTQGQQQQDQIRSPEYIQAVQRAHQRARERQRQSQRQPTMTSGHLQRLKQQAQNKKSQVGEWVRQQQQQQAPPPPDQQTMTMPQWLQEAIQRHQVPPPPSKPKRQTMTELLEAQQRMSPPPPPPTFRAVRNEVERPPTTSRQVIIQNIDRRLRESQQAPPQHPLPPESEIQFPTPSQRNLLEKVLRGEEKIEDERLEEVGVLLRVLEEEEEERGYEQRQQLENEMVTEDQREGDGGRGGGDEGRIDE